MVDWLSIKMDKVYCVAHLKESVCTKAHWNNTLYMF